MIFSIIGNNDAPLQLWKSLAKNNSPLPEIVGLQKKPEKSLWDEYQKTIPSHRLIHTFDEKVILEKLQGSTTQILINCFCNFKFKKLLYQYKCINIHLSYLPQYRGRHPMHWALINGEKSHGITIHKMNEKFDDGEILWQQKVLTDPSMSVLQLRELLIKTLEEAFPSFLKDFIQNLIIPQQNNGKKNLYNKSRKPADSLLTAWDDIDAIYRKIKALRSEKFPAYLNTSAGNRLLILDARFYKMDLGEIHTKNSIFPTSTYFSKNEILVHFNKHTSLLLTVSSLKSAFTKNNTIKIAL